MILTGAGILEEIQAGHIEISEFDEKRLNPNSYNLRLDKTLIVQQGPMDMRYPPPKGLSINLDDYPDGFLIYPGTLYLASTVERVHTDHYAPMIVGRSSVGRMGISVHQCAGFGDVGFDGVWTLSISTVVPVKIFAGVEICQTYFECVNGRVNVLYSGKYQKSRSIAQSKFFEEN